MTCSIPEDSIGTYLYTSSGTALRHKDFGRTQFFVRSIEIRSRTRHTGPWNDIATQDMSGNEYFQMRHRHILVQHTCIHTGACVARHTRISNRWVPMPHYWAGTARIAYIFAFILQDKLQLLTAYYRAEKTKEPYKSDRWWHTHRPRIDLRCHVQRFGCCQLASTDFVGRSRIFCFLRWEQNRSYGPPVSQLNMYTATLRSRKFHVPALDSAYLFVGQCA